MISVKFAVISISNASVYWPEPAPPVPPVPGHAEMHPLHATHFYGQIASKDATEGLPAADTPEHTQI